MTPLELPLKSNDQTKQISDKVKNIQLYKKLNSEISRYLNDRLTGCDFSFIMLFMLDTYIDSHCLIMRISIKSTLLWGKN